MTPTRAATISTNTTQGTVRGVLSRACHYVVGGSPRQIISTAMDAKPVWAVTRACVNFFPLFISRGQGAAHLETQPNGEPWMSLPCCISTRRPPFEYSALDSETPLAQLNPNRRNPLMSTPTAFEIKCANESFGTPWPNVTTLFKSIDARMAAGIDYDTIETPAPVDVVTRSCVRCDRPVEGDKCGHCRAIQASYRVNR